MTDTLNDVITRLQTNIPDRSTISIDGAPLGLNNRVLLNDVINFANWAHKGQFRFDGTLFLLHPLRTALNLVEHGIRDIIPISAAILHDTLEDSHRLTEELIRERYGNEIAHLVKVLTKPADKTLPKRSEQYLIGIVMGPYWAREIKVADRLDNLRSMFTVKHTGSHKNWPRKYFEQTISEVLPIAALVSDELRNTFLTELWKVRDEIEREY